MKRFCTYAVFFMLVLDNTVFEHVLDGYKCQFPSMPRGLSKQAILEASIKNSSDFYTVKSSVLYKNAKERCFFFFFFFFTNLYSTWFTVKEWQAKC